MWPTGDVICGDDDDDDDDDDEDDAYFFLEFPRYRAFLETSWSHFPTCAEVTTNPWEGLSTRKVIWVLWINSTCWETACSDPPLHLLRFHSCDGRRVSQL